MRGYEARFRALPVTGVESSRLAIVKDARARVSTRRSHVAPIEGRLRRMLSMRGGGRGETRVFGTARAAAGCLGALTFQRIACRVSRTAERDHAYGFTALLGDIRGASPKSEVFSRVERSTPRRHFPSSLPFFPFASSGNTTLRFAKTALDIDSLRFSVETLRRQGFLEHSYMRSDYNRRTAFLKR